MVRVSSPAKLRPWSELTAQNGDGGGSCVGEEPSQNPNLRVACVAVRPLRRAEAMTLSPRQHGKGRVGNTSKVHVQRVAIRVGDSQADCMPRSLV